MFYIYNKYCTYRKNIFWKISNMYKSRDSGIMNSPHTHNPAQQLSTNSQFVSFTPPLISLSTFLIVLK